MKKTILFGITLLFIGFFVSCCLPFIDEDESTGKVIKVTGTMLYMTLEGGFWIIAGDNGVKYTPFNLAAELKKEGLRARFRLKLLNNDFSSIYMFGIYVKIISYEILRKN